MAVYASPFFQNILSLTEHCVPPPPVTTYQDHFVDPSLRGKNGKKYVDLEAQKLLTSLKLIKPDGRFAVKANYCTPQSFEGSKKYQEALKSKRLCSKRITTYMIDYQSPHDRRKLFELFELTGDENPDFVSLREKLKVEDKKKKHSTCDTDGTENKTDDQQNNGKPNLYVCGDKGIAPKWKVEGWKAKKNCWLRPLKERENYSKTLEWKTSKIKAMKIPDAYQR